MADSSREFPPVPPPPEPVVEEVEPEEPPEPTPEPEDERFRVVIVTSELAPYSKSGYASFCSLFFGLGGGCVCSEGPRKAVSRCVCVCLGDVCTRKCVCTYMHHCIRYWRVCLSVCLFVCLYDCVYFPELIQFFTLPAIHTKCPPAPPRPPPTLTTHTRLIAFPTCSPLLNVHRRGLADVCSKLSIALSQMGHRVMTVSPAYRNVSLSLTHSVYVYELCACVRACVCVCVFSVMSVSVSVSVPVPVSVSQLLLFTQGIVLTFYTTHIVH